MLVAPFFQATRGLPACEPPTRNCAARGGDPQGEPVGGARRGHEPPARPVHRAPGEAEPQGREREAAGQGPQEIPGRAPDLPLLRRPVGRLLLRLRSGLRPRRHASGGQHLRHRRPLRSPPPDLQGPDEAGLSVTRVDRVSVKAVFGSSMIWQTALSAISKNEKPRADGAKPYEEDT